MGPQEQDPFSPGPSVLSASPVSCLPEHQNSPLIVFHDDNAATPIELPASKSQVPPIELDSTSCSPIAELSASPVQQQNDIPPYLSNPSAGLNSELRPVSPGHDGLSITTPEGVVLAPNLTSENYPEHQHGATEHVTSFMDFQIHKTSPRARHISTEEARPQAANPVEAGDR